MKNENNVEKQQLKNIFIGIYKFVYKNEDWEHKLPVSESVSFEHKQFGSINISLSLHKRFHTGFQKEAFILELDVTIGRGTNNRRISVGDILKVKTDIKHFCENIDDIYKQLPQIYMSILEYPSPRYPQENTSKLMDTSILKPMSREKLKEQLVTHNLWFQGKTRGIRLELQDIDFSGVDLSNIQLPGVLLKNVRFDEANLQKTFLNRSEMFHVSFKETNLTESVFSGAVLNGVDFSKAILKQAMFDVNHGNDLTFEGTRMDDIFMVKAYLKQSVFKNVSLRKANLRRIHLSNSKFFKVDFTGTDFSFARLFELDFQNITLSEVNMDSVHIIRPRLNNIYGLPANTENLKVIISNKSDKEVDITHIFLEKIEEI